MPSIEQVTKRLTSDRNWFNKCMIGLFLTIVPIVNLLAFGYLYRLFEQGKEQREIKLSDWKDWKGLFIDGLKFLIVFVIFAAAPIGIMAFLVNALPGDSFLAKIPMAPALFFAGPLGSAALYLFLLRGDFKDCFNFSALVEMLKQSLSSYWAPTLAFIGLLWMLPFAFFFGGVIYFYLMGYIFKNLEVRADKR